MGILEEIKNKAFKTNFELAMVNLVYTSNWFNNLHKQQLTKYGLLQQHYNVLRIANGKYPEPVTPSYIKEVMLDKGPDVTRLVDKLVKLELVDRCLKEDNRRMVEIRLNKKGKKILNDMTNEIEHIREEYFGLNEKEAKQLSDLLDKMRKS